MARKKSYVGLGILAVALAGGVYFADQIKAKFPSIFNKGGQA